MALSTPIAKFVESDDYDPREELLSLHELSADPQLCFFLADYRELLSSARKVLAKHHTHKDFAVELWVNRYTGPILVIFPEGLKAAKELHASRARVSDGEVPAAFLDLDDTLLDSKTGGLLRKNIDFASALAESFSPVICTKRPLLNDPRFQHEFAFNGKIVVGKILSVQSHSTEDKWFICEVNVEDDFPLTVLTTLESVCVGMKVPVALPGTSLRKDKVVKPFVIGSVKSDGYLCSAKDLGIDGPANVPFEFRGLTNGDDVRYHMHFGTIFPTEKQLKSRLISHPQKGMEATLTAMVREEGVATEFRFMPRIYGNAQCKRTHAALFAYYFNDSKKMPGVVYDDSLGVWEAVAHPHLLRIDSRNSHILGRPQVYWADLRHIAQTLLANFRFYSSLYCRENVRHVLEVCLQRFSEKERLSLEVLAFETWLGPVWFVGKELDHHLLYDRLSSRETIAVRSEGESEKENKRFAFFGKSKRSSTQKVIVLAPEDVPVFNFSQLKNGSNTLMLTLDPDCILASQADAVCSDLVLAEVRKELLLSRSPGGESPPAKVMRRVS